MANFSASSPVNLETDVLLVQNSNVTYSSSPVFASTVIGTEGALFNATSIVSSVNHSAVYNNQINAPAQYTKIVKRPVTGQVYPRSN